MPGLLDLLAPGATTNQPANGTDFMSALQGPQALSPMMTGNGFNLASPQTPQAAPQSLMQLMQNLWGIKQPNTPPYNDPGFANLPFQPEPAQLARMQQLAQIFPAASNKQQPDYAVDNVLTSQPYAPTPAQAARMTALPFPRSSNVQDRRGVMEGIPPALPLEQAGTDLYSLMQRNSQWPMRGGPMFRYGGQ
jgi:hypothetical protein